MFKLNQGHTVVVEKGSNGGEWQNILGGVVKKFGGLDAKYLRGWGWSGKISLGAGAGNFFGRVAWQNFFVDGMAKCILGGLAKFWRMERHGNIFLGGVAKYFGDGVPNLKRISGKL